MDYIWQITDKPTIIKNIIQQWAEEPDFLKN